MKEEDRLYLLELARELEEAERVGADWDAPEGTRYVQISDTLTRMIAARLREIAQGKDELLRAWLDFSHGALEGQWWASKLEEEGAEVRTMEGSQMARLREATERFLEEPGGNAELRNCGEAEGAESG